MLLNGPEIQRCRALVEKAFPRFAHWAFVNERNDSYGGFCVWGRYKANPGTSASPSFFVTFSAYKDKWKGHLTAGKHCYYWSSAGVGDAHLLDTKPCATLEEAITALKRRIGGLLAALLAPEAEPGAGAGPCLEPGA
jgi:hypothetical protein